MINETNKKSKSTAEEDKLLCDQKDNPKINYDKNSSHKLEYLEKSASHKIDLENFVYKEGGWGWVVVLACGYSFGVLMGLTNNYALIYNELDAAYNKTEHRVVYAAWIGSSATGIQYVGCIFGSILTDLFGARRVGFVGSIISTIAMALSISISNIQAYFLTYSLLFGLGQALLLGATLAILPHYFKKKLSLANGLMSLLGSVIVITLPICTDLTIKAFGLKGTFIFLTMLSLVNVFMSLTYKSVLPTHHHDNPLKRVRKSLGLKVLRKKEFIIWSVCSLIGQFGYLIPIVVIDHHSEKCFPDPAHKPVYLNIVFAIASGLGSLIFGKLGDITKFNRIYYHSLFFLCYGIVQLTIPFATHFYTLLIQSALLGVFDGVYLSFIVPICSDITGSSKLANQAAGFHHMVISIPSVSGPVVAGSLYENFHNYELAFFIGGSTCLVGAFLQTLLVFLFSRFN